MSNESIIKIQGLGKKYKLGYTHRDPYKSLAETLSSYVKKARRLEASSHHIRGKDTEFWALQDLNLEIKRGERVGIIGHNGAGKSTLLKLLSRITEPSTGSIELYGRVASLLEVGTGFHPELSGRENIYLNGAILGMSRSEIKSKFDEIVDFAEVEKFLETPVKRYSSGMYVRLAFAVAAHLEPEILVVDEVLAVGDASFQKKCLGKMQSVAENEGRTVLFVSHQMPMITSLCNRCILLSNGSLIDDGNPASVILRYQTSATGSSAFIDYRDHPNPPGDSSARLLSAWIENRHGSVDSELNITDEFSVHITYELKQKLKTEPFPNIHVFDSRGSRAFVSSPSFKVSSLQESTNRRHAICHIPGNLLNDGLFSISVALTTLQNGRPYVHFNEKNALNIVIVDPMTDVPTRNLGYTGSYPGVFRPLLDWEISHSDVYP